MPLSTVGSKSSAMLPPFMEVEAMMGHLRTFCSAASSLPRFHASSHHRFGVRLSASITGPPSLCQQVGNGSAGSQYIDSPAQFCYLRDARRSPCPGTAGDNEETEEKKRREL